jgi:hypothetical protein
MTQTLVSIIKSTSTNPLNGKLIKQIQKYDISNFGLNVKQAIELKKGESVINYINNNGLKVGGFYKVESVSILV